MRFNKDKKGKNRKWGMINKGSNSRKKRMTNSRVINKMEKKLTNKISIKNK